MTFCIDNSKPDNVTNPKTNSKTNPKPLLGEHFEMGLCLKLGIPYNKKKDRIDMEFAIQISNCISEDIIAVIGSDFIHNQESTARYDFTSADGSGHLSCKTSLGKVCKIAPSVIGQSSRKTFCEQIGVPLENDQDLKRLIQEENRTVGLLNIFQEYTFDCPILYYNDKEHSVKLIKMIQGIDWESLEYEWTKHYSKWHSSSTLRYNGTAIMEIQFHSNRPGLAFRWYLDNVLTLFRDHFIIQ